MPADDTSPRRGGGRRIVVAGWALWYSPPRVAALPEKLAVISDLHANFEALKVVVNWCAQHQIDHIICLGDIIGYNANPVEVTYLTHSRVRFSLKGNHERYVLGEEARGV